MSIISDGSARAINSAPVADKILRISAWEDTPRLSKIFAIDPDNDPLNFSIGIAPSNGTLVVQQDGLYTYTPFHDYVGPDNFSFVISDGALTTIQAVEMWIYRDRSAPTNPGQTNGGTVVTPTPPLNAGIAPYRMFAADGFVGEIGGHGTIFGTQGLQDISVLDQPGTVTFDGSFNQGGDIIRLAGAASNWSISVSGSNAIFADGDTAIVIPYGTVGTAVVFADGVRSLHYDLASDALAIGSQTVGLTAAQITAETDNSALPTGRDDGARGRIFISSGGDVSVNGDSTIFGTAGHETVRVSQGHVTLDGSFNLGGDRIEIDTGSDPIAAKVSGSNVILTSDDLELIIPYGANGTTIAINGSDQYTLRYDAQDGVLFGDRIIGDHASYTVWNGVFG